MKIVITGHPLVLKNSKQIIVVKGRRLIKSNPRVEAYQHRAIKEIIDQLEVGHKPIGGPIHVEMLFYGAWKKDTKAPDLDNLLCLPLDLLTAAGVIEDDSLVESLDGSRRVRMCDSCDKRPVIKAGVKKGQRKDDCGRIRKCNLEKIVIEINGVVNEQAND